MPVSAQPPTHTSITYSLKQREDWRSLGGGEESCERKWRPLVPPTGYLHAKSLLPARDVFAASDFGAAQRRNGTLYRKPGITDGGTGGIGGFLFVFIGCARAKI